MRLARRGLSRLVKFGMVVRLFVRFGFAAELNGGVDFIDPHAGFQRAEHLENDPIVARFDGELRAALALHRELKTREWRNLDVHSGADRHELRRGAAWAWNGVEIAGRITQQCPSWAFGSVHQRDKIAAHLSGLSREPRIPNRESDLASSAAQLVGRYALCHTGKRSYGRQLRRRNRFSQLHPGLACFIFDLQPETGPLAGI